MSTMNLAVPEGQELLTKRELETLNKPKKSGAQLAGGIASLLGIAFIITYCILPFLWMVITSLRLPTMGLSTDFIPNPVSVENYRIAFNEKNNFLTSLGNSVLIATVTTALTLLFGIVAAYALARLRFTGKALVLAIIIGCSMFPAITILVPLLKMFTGNYDWLPINWMNQYQAAIIPSLSFGLPLCVWNLTAFFRQLPVELEQAAMVDGCTPTTAFRKIILPLAAPGIFTTIILTFIAVWNEYMFAMTFLADKGKMTAPVALAGFQGDAAYNIPYGAIMAAGVVVTVPLLAMVLIFQRRIVAGLTAGGVK
ncbi:MULTISPECIES: carbohydrate ABC transporter permease [unclassified Luteococcus]|uniref:carbohydrate ABC transporter permease n=1 Tax=unclassified Luteococcus TaxID=2639923 RepID=UPI00313B1F28